VDLQSRERLRVARRPQTSELARWLEGRVARGALEAAKLRAELGATRGCERAFLLSDLADAAAALAGAALRGGTRWTWIGIQAPLELEPGELGPVRWIDAESGDELALEVDAAALGAYGRALEDARTRLARAAAPRGIALARASSAEDFEHVLGRALRA